MKIRLALLPLLLLVGLFACSRPASVKQAPAKAAADATLSLAQNLEQKQRFLDSRQTYLSSLRQYRTFGDLRGEAYTLSGLARLAFLEGNMAEYSTQREALDQLVQLADPGSAHVLLLLDLYILQKQGNYTGIRDLAVDSYDFPLGIRMQVLTHALQAESHLNPGYGGRSAEDLDRLIARYRRSLKRDFSADPGVLAAALYAMAYHHHMGEDHATALQYVSEAVDWDERYENFGALGYDFWLRANILEALGESATARSNYIRAGNIFAHFENTAMLAKTEAAVMRLKGDRYEP
ncbi:MAG: hypothetical protein RBQ67_00885 [Candidatus Cloacimonadaceae bacterium]|nr:hypothetical protein [Candidatus Cloacimonadota bacterium]MDY0318529.1 hypothetical protein [Candidatus Cloacimonadaceae bacterium]